MRKQRNQTQGADELLDSNLVYILAQYGRPILFQKIQEWGENTAYKLKARYHGEIPVICNIEIVCARSQTKLVETIEELKEQLAEKINLVLKSKAL